MSQLCTCGLNLAEYELRFSPQLSMRVCSSCLRDIKRQLATSPIPAKASAKATATPAKPPAPEERTVPPMQHQSNQSPSSPQPQPPQQHADRCRTCQRPLLTPAERQQEYCAECVDRQWSWYQRQQHDATRYRQTPRTGYTRPPYSPQQHRNGR